MSWFGRGLLAGILWLAVLEIAVAGSRQTVLLHAFARPFLSCAFCLGDTRERLIGYSPNPVDICEASPNPTRFAEHGASAGCVHSLFAEQAAVILLDPERTLVRDLDRDIVVGPVLSAVEFDRRTATRYVGTLIGETSGTIKTARRPQGWYRSAAHLPPGGTVPLRERTGWERYRWPVIGGLTLLSLQVGMATWLLLERRGRRKAEVAARRRSLEVMHLSRSAEAGALSVSFAHELSQPLASIMLSTDAAEMLLEAEPSNVMRMGEILRDIRRADEHAAEIISHVQKLLKRRTEVEAQEFDLNGAIADAMQILLPEAKKRSVVLRAIGVQQRLPVRADRIHLLQVTLNLARNGMDAMTGTAPNARRMTIQTALLGESTVEVSVSDSGTGIPEDKLGEIFDTFYTTKEHGTGLGLTIARTIVETYGGKIWAENGAGGGAILRFTLPLSQHPRSRDRLAPGRIG